MLMVRKSKRISKKQSSRTSSGLRWSLSENEYLGVVALVALLLIAAIVLKGPSLIQVGKEVVAGQAFAKGVQGDTVPDNDDHPPRAYVAPQGWGTQDAGPDGPSQRL